MTIQPTEEGTSLGILPRGQEPETNRQRLEQVLNRSCKLFLEILATADLPIRDTANTQHRTFHPPLAAPYACDISALRIATAMVNFSLLASAEINLQSDFPAGSLPPVEITPHSDVDTPLNDGLFIDKTRQLTRALLNRMDREPCSSSWNLCIDYPQNAANHDEALLAARIAADILESEFGHEHLHAKTDEREWRKGGHLSITVERGEALTVPQM